MNKQSDLERCKERLIDSIKDLGGKINDSNKNEIDYIANLIIQSMTGTWRYFHTPEHIFEVGGNDEPIEIISALFHDMIYVQVDYGININLSGYIYPFVREENNQLFLLNDDSLLLNPNYKMLIKIFGFKLGDVLSPYAGQNEFLSALIAVQCMSNFLKLDKLTQIAACIESTIPFRKVIDGVSPYDKLKLRLIELKNEYSFKWKDSEIDNLLKKCVRMANRDVENFGNPNSVKFLDNTWNLMPETNHDLKTPTSYSIIGYRTSMMKMLNFLNFLKPEVVFHQYQNEPTTKKLNDLFKNTTKNLKLAKLYLEAKILTVGILEALSFRIGRNIPLSTLIGEIPVKGVIIPTLDHFLPEVPSPHIPSDPIETEVLDILTFGRNEETTYDLKNSPITSFLVKAIGFKELERLFDISVNFYDGKIEAEEFLEECDSFVLDSIISGVIKIFEFRTQKLTKLKTQIV